MFTKADIEKYFAAEKQATLLFMIIGAVAVAIALAGLFYWKTQFWKGASIPLVIIALIQVAVGYTVYARSDRQRTEMVYAYDMNPSKLRNEELPRMQKVNKNFPIYKWFEIALIALGIVLIIVYKPNAGRQHLYGMGVALLIQCMLLFAADYIAAKRALSYTKGIELFLEKTR